MTDDGKRFADQDMYWSTVEEALDHERRRQDEADERPRRKERRWAGPTPGRTCRRDEP